MVLLVHISDWPNEIPIFLCDLNNIIYAMQNGSMIDLHLEHCALGFLLLFTKYPLIASSFSSLPSRPLCLTEAGLGALLSKQS